MSLALVHEQADLNDKVAAEVRAALGRFQIKQSDLAAVLGVTQTQVSRRLRGDVPFTLRDVEVIAEWFSTSPAVLMGYLNEPALVRPQGIEPWTRGSSHIAAHPVGPEPRNNATDNDH